MSVRYTRKEVRLFTLLHGSKQLYYLFFVRTWKRLPRARGDLQLSDAVSAVCLKAQGLGKLSIVTNRGRRIFKL